MSTTPMTKIREEFEEYCDTHENWDRHDIIADWFINRFQQELSSLEREIKNDIHKYNTGVDELGYFVSLNDVLEIIRQHKER